MQEALTNAVKHAAARIVEVDVSDGDDHVSISVRDDGQGFDPSERSAGFGLLGMRERLALVRGTLTIESPPGSGTLVCVRIPIHRRAEAA